MGFVVNIKGKKSHAIVQQALQVLRNLQHRGACGSEVNTGDGAGILMQVPHAFLDEACREMKIALPGPGEYGVGMVFLPPHPGERYKCEVLFEDIVATEGLQLLGWRTVPTEHSSLGQTAIASEPIVRQVFIARPDGLADDLAFERKLYVVRKLAEHGIRAAGLRGGDKFYVCSLSAKTMIYKGMLTPDQVERYYPDLTDSSLASALCLVHSRFSTNTFPTWERAHPYRYVAHNGEINTLRGNINWMHARQSLFASDLFGDDLKKLLPVINEDGSDSAMFDNALEFLALSGRSLPHAVMMMIPEPWENHESMNAEKRAFYEYHSCLQEPWDGPASIAFTDGVRIGACLDRNGLRPSRYYVTKDGRVIMASEVGVLDLPPETIVQKGRLQPGRMFLIDTEQGRIVADEELKNKVATEHPYQVWLDRNHVLLENLPEPPHVHEPDHRTVLQRQQAFGYTFEDLRFILGPMANDSVQPLGSMGTDTPLAVLSNKPQLLYNYFKQLFAQVTNPPIDPIREDIITSTETMVGSEGNLLEPTPKSCRMIKLQHPILTNEDLEKLRHVDRAGFKAGHAADFVPGGGRRPGSGKRARPVVRRRRQGHCRRLEHHHSFRPRHQRRKRADSRDARRGGTASSFDPAGHAHARRARARIGRAARSPPFCAAHRLRLQRHQSLPRVRLARRPDQRGIARGHGPQDRRQKVHQGGGQRRGKDDGQDGHLDHPELPGRADFRGHRIEPQCH